MRVCALCVIKIHTPNALPSPSPPPRTFHSDGAHRATNFYSKLLLTTSNYICRFWLLHNLRAAGSDLSDTGLSSLWHALIPDLISLAIASTLDTPHTTHHTSLSTLDAPHVLKMHTHIERTANAQMELCEQNGTEKRYRMTWRYYNIFNYECPTFHFERQRRRWRRGRRRRQRRKPRRWQTSTMVERDFH